ncbi:hypothetical protein ATZ33_16140 [Enterococcus silesiacus]|nr:DUF1700 domain-containing protein [Enterococcus silesiacus]ALS02850.1 hypothetical protein ATZ33_16140 [Enterococcus silesiacus]
MNKEHFLIELKIYLKPLNSQQQALILNKYETIFEERLAEGDTEEQIAKSLGKPRGIAEEILQEFDISVPEKRIERDGWQEIQPVVNNDYYYEEELEHPYEDPYRSYERPHHNGFTRFCQIAGVLSFNFLFMFWIIFAFIMVFFAFWLVGVVFLFSPILGGISVFTGFNDGAMFQLFASIFLSGAGIVGLLILTPLTKFFGKCLQRYLQWNVRVLRGEV